MVLEEEALSMVLEEETSTREELTLSAGREEPAKSACLSLQVRGSWWGGRKTWEALQIPPTAQPRRKAGILLLGTLRA